MIFGRKKRVILSSIVGEGEIDMAPLIDCVFLLLIFFMISTVFITVKGLVVDLPSNADSEEQQQQKKDVNINISAEGEYTVMGVKTTSTELASAIMGAMNDSNNKNVIIQGDARSWHRDVVYAMDTAYSVGAEGMAFAIEQESDQTQ